jgi:hypothetical protein
MTSHVETFTASPYATFCTLYAHGIRWTYSTASSSHSSSISQQTLRRPTRMILSMVRGTWLGGQVSMSVVLTCMLQRHNPLTGCPCALYAPGGRSGFEPVFTSSSALPLSIHSIPAQPNRNSAAAADDEHRALYHKNDNTDNPIHSALTSHIQFTSLASLLLFI